MRCARNERREGTHSFPLVCPVWRPRSVETNVTGAVRLPVNDLFCLALPLVVRFVAVEATSVSPPPSQTLGPTFSGMAARREPDFLILSDNLEYRWGMFLFKFVTGTFDFNCIFT